MSTALENLKKNIGVAPTTTRPLTADLNTRGTTQPDTPVPSSGSALGNLRANLQSTPAQKPVTSPSQGGETIQIGKPTEDPSLWDKYSNQVNRKIASFDAGFVQSAGQLMRSFQWLGDRLVGDRLVQNASDEVLASEMKATDDMLKIYRDRKAKGDEAGAKRALEQLKVMSGNTTPYEAYANTKDSVFYKAQDKTQEWADILKAKGGITKENQTFSDRVFEGAGSSATYFIPSLGVFKGATVLSAVSPKIAMMFAGSAGAGLEAMAEAGSTYDEWEKKGNLQKAGEESTKVFLSNAILLAVTNQLGIFNPAKLGILKRALLSAPTEGFQEALQQIIQNEANDRPIWEGVLEAGAIGAIIGTVMGGVTDIVTTQTKESQERGKGLPPTPTTPSPAVEALRERLNVTPAIDQQRAIEAGQPAGTSLPSPTGTVPQNGQITPEVTPTEGKGSGLVADVRLPEIAPVEPRQKEDAFKAFEKLAKRVKSLEDFNKKINEAEIDNLDDVVQFHGTQNKDFSKALKEGTLRVSEDGVIGKGFYVTNTPELADYFGKQVKDGNSRTMNGEKPEIFAIDLRDLNIKKLPFGKGEYYDYLDSRKMSPNDFNAELAQQGYDGLNLEGRGETVIFNSTKVKELPLSGMVKQPKKKKELSQESEAESKQGVEESNGKETTLWTNKLGLEKYNGTSDVKKGDTVTFNGKKWTIRTILEMTKGDTKYEMVLQEDTEPTVNGAEITKKYWNEVIQPRIEKGEAVVIGADDLKDYFGKDYDLKNHKVYSKSANDLFERAVTELKETTVKLMAGGTGSGKSDFLVPDVSENFAGVVYDSTAWNPEGMLKQIEFVKSKGKTAEVYGIISDLKRSRAYTFKRETEGKHPVREQAFINTHSGSIDTMLKVIEQGVNVYVLDTRDITSKEQVANAEYELNPVDTLEGLGYNKDYVSNEIKEVTTENYEEVIDGRKESSRSVPPKNRTGKEIGLVDYDSSYTPRMNSLIREAQEKGETFPYSKMTPEEQKIVDSALTKMLESIPVKVPKGFKPYEATITTKTVDVKRLNEPAYFKEVYESTFAVGGDKGLYYIMKKELVPKDKETSGFLADLYKKAKAELRTETKESVTTPKTSEKKGELRLEIQEKPEAKENPIMTEVQGKEVPRFGFKREFGSKKLEPFKTKPLITKTDLKTIIKYTPELKANPVLTVEMETVDGQTRPLLTFRGTSTQFEIKANALGLTEDSLKTGDQVRISIESLSRTGSEFRVIKYDDKGVGSKYASVGRYRDDTEMFLSNPDAIKPIQFPELVGLAKELSGNVPFLRKYKKANGMFYPRGDGEIGLNPALFERENLGQLTKTLAHEIGHLVDYLPDHTMKRGNLMGRLNTLRGFMKDFYQPAGQSRTDAELREQMYALSVYWRPYDEKTASPSFISYRKSATEVYADFISALFNDPRLVSSMAPTAYNVFFEQLDNKPNVKEAYFELQSLLRTGDITATRRTATTEMFKLTEQESKERQIQNQIEQEEREKSIWFKFKTQAVDITEIVKEKVKEAEKRGGKINPDDNPTYYLEERNYIGGKIKSEVDTKFNTIYQELQKDGMTWEDLGELMMYERILKGDRQEIANPLGYQPDFVQELMEVYEDVGQVQADAEAHAKSTSDMKTTLGEDKYRKLQALAVEYRANLKAFFEQGVTEGIYSEDLAKLFSENAFYVPFKGAKYSGVTRTTFGVKQQKGTLGNIENPANTGIEKAVSIIRAIERNKVTRKTVEFFKSQFPEEVQDAKLDQQGYPINPREENLALVTYMQDGKVKGFYVDKYIADAIQKNTIAEQNLLIGSLKFWNSRLFRPLFITFNLGFQTFNLLRDMKRFWKNVPNMTILKTMRLYAQSVRASKIRAFGLPNNPSQADLEAYDLINRLENEQIISLTYNDIIKGENIEDAQIERILREVGVREVQDTNLGLLGKKIGLTKETPIIKQAFQIMDFIENLGNMIESLPKVAGVKELEGKMQPREMRSFVRKYVGSPDFLAGGQFKPYMNEVFLFSNAIFQGIRSDYEIATQPTTRGAYWLKTAQSELLPKMLMLMATAGLFGEYLKELFGKVSEYDKTNYTIIPLGTDQNGKTIYFRMPSDETGRLIGGAFWKLGNALSEPEKLAELTTYTDMLSYAGGQVPSVTPVVTAGFNLMQFVAGENPYDFFRQRPVLTDDQQEAGGMERTKPFVTFMFQQLGGNVFVKLYTNETVPKNPSLSEKIASLPVVGNIAGRFIKASNYGEVEAIRKVTDEVKQGQAQERLVNRRTVYDYVERSQGMSYPEAEALKKQMILEIYGEYPKTPSDRTQARNLEKRFDTLRLRGTADARLDALLVAQTNEEKTVLLRKYRDELSPEAWNELKSFIIKNRVVSSAVFEELNRVEN